MSECDLTIHKIIIIKETVRWYWPVCINEQSTQQREADQTVFVDVNQFQLGSLAWEIICQIHWTLDFQLERVERWLKGRTDFVVLAQCDQVRSSRSWTDQLQWKERILAWSALWVHGN